MDLERIMVRKIVYHIRAQNKGSKWILRNEDENSHGKTFKSKEEAVRYAQMLGKEWRLDSFVVYKVNGEFEASYSFAEIARE